MRVCGGYILIKSKWFQSTKSLEITGTLPTLVPEQGFVLEQSRVSKPLSKGLLKLILLKNLWIRHCNGYTLQQRIKISKIIKISSMTDNSAGRVCHIWNLLHKQIYSLLLFLNLLWWSFFEKCNQSVKKVSPESNTKQKQKNTYLTF